MSTKSPDPVDVQVGSRIRLLRKGAQMSQTDLAEQLGVTFQQVQKYEKGVSRISAGRLTKIAAALRVPVSEVLGDDGTRRGNRRGVDEARSLKVLTVPGALRLLKAYAQISDGHQRRNIDHADRAHCLGAGQVRVGCRSFEAEDQPQPRANRQPCAHDGECRGPLAHHTTSV